ncbi:hypothetical protein J31TS4_15260 [Paenibacillus sp. J31TS4]|uniref:FxsA family protein n=1 Tax=Paenibacillus sp. J31TS4 TaxID=2807195 RepID=UPI001B1FC432|nr:FxsA family protein [Paenibacillus sp. J31TS4]GIP38246.1 hypothetical protein J31TS4_15260 [Paenibacillus sp. J31TS4]
MRRIGRLPLLLLLFPALELVVLYLVGRWIGGWPTLVLLLVSALAGALLVKREARKAWQFAKLQWASGQMPGQALLDGMCLFAGGVLLIVPGFLSDLIGLFLVLPFTRPLAKAWLLLLLRRLFERGQARIFIRR